MERELSKFDRQSIIVFEFLDTPGDEVAPGSDEIGEYFQDEWFGHDFLLLKKLYQSFQTFKPFKSSKVQSLWVDFPQLAALK